MPATSQPQSIEDIYRDRIDAMTPRECVARSAAMFVWTRQQISRQIVAEYGTCSAETLKWRLAMRLYGNEPVLKAIIQQKLADVPG